MYTKTDIFTDLSNSGICKGDTVIVHSSFKSLGELENGADTIVSALLETVGEEGTVVFPTLCNADWKNVYKNWHPDAMSYVGYLTNYFRKLPGALRSNQATHSVAAIGKNAEYITKTHGETGRIPGPFGDTCFSKDSPWEKLYELDAKILLIGVGAKYITLRHLAEYRVVGKYLELAEKCGMYEVFKNELWLYERWDDGGISAMIDPEAVEVKTAHLAQKCKIGNAECMIYSTKEFVDICGRVYTERLDGWMDENTARKLYDWMDRIEKAACEK